MRTSNGLFLGSGAWTSASPLREKPHATVVHQILGTPGRRLIDQIREALTNDLYPIFVAEGESAQKYKRIRHSDFLHKAYRSFQEIGGTLFIYGHAMSPNDEHIIRLIGRGKVERVFVGIYGDEDSVPNRAIRRRVEQLQGVRSARKPLEADFFDAASAGVWG